MKTTTLSLLLSAAAINAAPQLLPFQGHLTEASGSAIEDGTKVVQFKIYDAPVSGTAVWAGEVHKLSVNGGLVNTILGSKTSLNNVDFADPLYLEITVDAQADGTSGHGQITAADPPLLPRQVLLPAVFASEAANTRQVQGIDVFSNGKLKPSLIDSNTIPAEAIVADDSIQASQLAGNSVDTIELKDEAVTGAKLKDGTIEMADLAAELVRELLPPGTIQAYAGTSPPPGWLMCDGSIVTQTEYPYLWDVIEVSHGAGTSADGDFHLPDYRGRFLRGTDDPDGPVEDDYSAAGNDLDFGASADLGVDGKRYQMAAGGVSTGVGSIQGDAVRNVTGQFNGGPTYNSTNANGVFLESSSPINTQVGTGRVNRHTYVTIDLSRQIPTASESRPKNAAVNFIIKY